jgi:hypothetical protein
MNKWDDMLWSIHLVIYQRTTIYEDLQESLYALDECLCNKDKTIEKYDFYPLSFEELEIAQK